MQQLLSYYNDLGSLSISILTSEQLETKTYSGTLMAGFTHNKPYI